MTVPLGSRIPISQVGKPRLMDVTGRPYRLRGFRSITREMETNCLAPRRRGAPGSTSPADCTRDHFGGQERHQHLALLPGSWREAGAHLALNRPPHPSLPGLSTSLGRRASGSPTPPKLLVADREAWAWLGPHEYSGPNHPGWRGLKRLGAALEVAPEWGEGAGPTAPAPHCRLGSAQPRGPTHPVSGAASAACPHLWEGAPRGSQAHPASTEWAAV